MWTCGFIIIIGGGSDGIVIGTLSDESICKCSVMDETGNNLQLNCLHTSSFSHNTYLLKNYSQYITWL